jgi:putative tricarboxylic transport membrane protein
MLDGILSGVGVAAQPINLLMVMVGCFAGTFIGMLPGLGPISAIALMIPITYGFDPSAGLILMAGVYYGAIFGGSTSSILINAPGVAGTVATSFDGYPDGQSWHGGQGAGDRRLFLLLRRHDRRALPAGRRAVAGEVSLSFQSTDYFALMVLGLTAVAAFAGKGNMVKALLMTVLGLMLSTVGTDQTQGVPRFTIRHARSDRRHLLPASGDGDLRAVGGADGGAAAQIGRRPSQGVGRAEEPRFDEAFSKAEVKEMAPVVGRSSVLGFLIGVLPGAGATIASFLAYGIEQRLAGPKRARSSARARSAASPRRKRPTTLPAQARSCRC